MNGFFSNVVNLLLLALERLLQVFLSVHRRTVCINQVLDQSPLIFSQDGLQQVDLFLQPHRAGIVGFDHGGQLRVFALQVCNLKFQVLYEFIRQRSRHVLRRIGLDQIVQ